MNEVEEKSSFIKNNYVSSIIASINGVVFYDIWPYIIIILCQIAFGDYYKVFVTTYETTATMILTLLTSFLTLGITLAIIKPKQLLNAFHKLRGRDVGYIFASIGFIMAFNVTYSIISSILFGINTSDGNANQQLVSERILGSPILAFFAMVIVAPVLEEVTYRYCVFGTFRNMFKKTERNNALSDEQPGIKHWTNILAIMCAAFVFMIVHGVAGFVTATSLNDILKEIILLPPYFGAGLILAKAYNDRENLLVSLLIHMTNNLISFMAILLLI